MSYHYFLLEELPTGVVAASGTLVATEAQDSAALVGTVAASGTLVSNGSRGYIRYQWHVRHYWNSGCGRNR